MPYYPAADKSKKVNKVKNNQKKRFYPQNRQNMASTKWGIISSGKICHDFVNAIQALENNADHEIVAVAARKIASAKEFAAKFNIAKVNFSSIKFDNNCS